MQPAILWLVRLGLEQELFTLEEAASAVMGAGENAELLDFAQQLIDDGHVEDVEALEKVAGLALEKSKSGPPPNDQYTGKILAESKPVSEPESSAAPPSAAPPSAAAPVATAPVGSGEIVVAADIDFAQVDGMSDDVLAKSMRSFLVHCGDRGVSDLHLSAGARPFVRKERALQPISEHVLTEDESSRLNTILLAPHQLDIFLKQKDYDFALALDSQHRYRVNLMFHKDGVSGAYRIIAAEVPKLDDLGLRNVETIRKLLTFHNGLLLVTGPVGAGKTTTLAALVNELNRARKDHIITVEDPVEVVQKSIGCNVTQRQVGEHTRSFSAALKGALREDPDIIVIGELRDLETIEMAISASETGHLVIGTMHTSDAATTLNRLLDVFPPAQQTQIRASVAESLRGIVCQRILPTQQGGLVLACEILVANMAVSALIRDGKTQGLRNVMETGVREGMCVMENSVMELYRQKKISAEVARQNVVTKQVLAQIK